MPRQPFPGFFADAAAPSRAAHVVAMNSSFEKRVNQRDLHAGRNRCTRPSIYKYAAAIVGLFAMDANTLAQ
jgi:hypothetical protein